MSGLSSMREALAEDLAAGGLKTFSHFPPKLQPPVAVVAASDPYVEQGDTLRDDQFQINLTISLVAATGTNAVITDALDGLIEQALAHTPDWHVEDVSAPFIATVNDSQFLTARVAVSRMFTIEIEGVTP